MVLTCTFTRTDRSALMNQVQSCQVVHFLSCAIYKILSFHFAARSDGIYCEMLKAASNETSCCLTAFWSACGRTAPTLMKWRNVPLVPIYKKGDPEIPLNYRPICLLSSLRKVIERTLDKEMQAHYAPNVMQMGFQAKLGAEIAIARMSISLRLKFDSGSDGIPGRIGTARLPSSGLEVGGSGSQTVSRSRSWSLLKSRDRSRERRFQCSKEVDVKRRPIGFVVLVLLQNGCNNYVAPSRAFSANWTRLTRICGAFLLIHSLIYLFLFRRAPGIWAYIHLCVP